MVQATGRQRPDRGTIDDLRLDPRSAITRGPQMESGNSMSQNILRATYREWLCWAIFRPPGPDWL